ncbi:hypothetical protein AOLI_G00029310 [Acnodon oligacanthus]
MCHCRCSEEDTRCVPKCPLLCSSAQSNNATGYFPHDLMLSQGKLKTELSLIYSKEEFKAGRGAVGRLQLCKENNLEDFSETVSLLKILITKLTTTAEAERCISTLERMKTFLRNSVAQDRLNALAMLSVEKRRVTETTDFNVIEKVAGQKERRAKFLFK